MEIPITKAQNNLSSLLKQLDKGCVSITRRGKIVGVIISPAEYEKLRQVSAYLQMVNISRSLRDSGLTAAELYQASRQELEQDR